MLYEAAVSVGCIVSASTSVTDCRITQSDGTLVRLAPASGGACEADRSSVSDEKMRGSSQRGWN